MRELAASSSPPLEAGLPLLLGLDAAFLEVSDFLPSNELFSSVLFTLESSETI